MSDHPTPMRRVAVLGAGVMGAGIAAHLANAGFAVLLLDLKSDEVSAAEQAAGITPDDPRVRSRRAAGGVQELLNSASRGAPAAFFVPDHASRIAIGNFEDDLPRLARCDWVIEAVVEDLDVKRSLFARLGEHLAAHAIVSSNTSGLSAAALSDALPAELRSRFVVTHFFNPPRYLHLLEIVPGPETSPRVVERITRVAERRLGKGVVVARDTPNFIANRIGIVGFLQTLDVMTRHGLTVSEVDAWTGQLVGRPKSATFRTADLVGVDVLMHVVDNLRESLPDDPARELLDPPAFLKGMVERGWLGQKAGQGFYRKERRPDGASVILELDPAAMSHRAAPPARGGTVFGAVRGLPDTAARLRALVWDEGWPAGAAPDADDVELASGVVWGVLSASMVYAAEVLGDIADDVVAVDRAMRWGFGWEHGPFELWDLLGVERCAERLRAEGRAVPPVVEALLASGAARFTAEDDAGLAAWSPSAGARVSIPPRPRVLELARCPVVFETPDAALHDLGDDVVCLAFRTKMNTITGGVADALTRSVELAEQRFAGLVIGNEQADFSAGANLHMVLGAIQKGAFDEVGAMVKGFQDLNQRLRFASVPVVVAPRGRTLGGGCEISLAGDAICAAAETYIGLVEVGAGLIPAGGGCKEMLRRLDERLPRVAPLDLLPFLQDLFGVIGMGRVATSAVEARRMGFLGERDHVVMNADHLLADARTLAASLAELGYRPPDVRRDIRVMGEPGEAAMRVGLWNMAEGRQISRHDTVVGTRLAHVLCGGTLSGGGAVSEQHLLELEREAFLALCGEQATQERMAHLLKTGKPLRN